jgi:DNA-binding transcriptional MerR regulator/glutaredoxin
MGKSDDTTTFTIGELARRFSLNVRTLRYYESVELLSTPARSAGGYRLYTAADEERLRFVLQAKRVGFSLDEIREIIRLGQHGKACDYVRDTLSRHVERVEAQIAELQAVHGELSSLQAAWQEPDNNCSADGRLCRLIEEWSSAAPTDKENKPMTTGKRQVEVFIAGCPLCEPVVELVQRVACTDCEVTVHNIKDDAGAAERAKAAGVVRVPMVLIDGKPAECCTSSGAITEEGLCAAGIGMG